MFSTSNYSLPEFSDCLSTLNENFLCNYSFSNVLSQIIDSESVVL